jgi:Domain of unknown function DUF11
MPHPFATRLTIVWRLSLALSLAIVATSGVAGEGELPGDVSVALSATPRVNLVPGQRVEFTVTVTNLGPAEIAQPFLLSSSMIVDELDTGYTESSDCVVITEVVDLRNGGSYYLLNWEVIGLPPDVQTLEVGGSVTCRFSEAVTSAFPPNFLFGMSLATLWTDPNPNNNSVSVLLQRAPIAAPAMTVWALLVLAGSLMLTGAIGYIRRRAKLIC